MIGGHDVLIVGVADECCEGKSDALCIAADTRMHTRVPPRTSTPTCQAPPPVRIAQQLRLQVICARLDLSLGVQCRSRIVQVCMVSQPAEFPCPDVLQRATIAV